MKKNYYLLSTLFISVLTIFSACSDDDDNGGGTTNETVKEATLNATAYDKWVYFNLSDGTSVSHDIEPVAGTYAGDVFLDVEGRGSMGTVEDLKLAVTRIDGDSLTLALDDFTFGQYELKDIEVGAKISADTIGWSLEGGTMTINNIVITPKGYINGDSINIVMTMKPGAMPMNLLATFKGIIETRSGIDESSFAWDIALHRYDVKTNGASALATTESNIANVTSIPASGYTADVKTDSIMVNTAGMMNNKIGYASDHINEVLNKGIEFDSSIMPPPTTAWSMSGLVYVLKLASGDYAKIKFTDYSNETGTSGHISFEYVYPFK